MKTHDHQIFNRIVELLSKATSRGAVRTILANLIEYFLTSPAPAQLPEHLRRE